MPTTANAIKNHLNTEIGVPEKAQQIRALITLAEDPGLVPSTYVVADNLL